MKLCSLSYSIGLMVVLATFSGAHDYIKCVRCKNFTGEESVPENDADMVGRCGYVGPCLPPGVSVCQNLRQKKFVTCNDRTCGQYFSMNIKNSDTTPSQYKQCPHQWKIPYTTPTASTKAVPMLDLFT
ncbi:hypothetical protein PGT21_002735 [Puccinia graminis f. sp. tritici]|uniref:Uncharacterized protein n=1 Tax=Puccinia graminis f. sp. tritici TaxID=56615 RepID=A0A5B0SB68_PUCGR|nr:hypothetical protein PGT21_002735 [Puccinia graminis f. sp. tritici]KAA1134769.1 hypothetical protein PGTUg99_005328 [Puccinia graminis f. sp. tritici]